MTKLLEPRIHSYITDELPNDHPLAHKSVDCDECNLTLHESTNECINPWAETGKGNYCLKCFSDIDQHAEITDEYGLKS